MSFSRSPLLGGLLGLFVVACSGDHGDLGTGSGASSGGGGAGAGSTTTTGTDAGSTTSAGGAGSSTTTTSSGAGGSGGSVPAGPTTLTIVNGVNDAEAIRLCFLDYPDATNSDAKPWPPDAAGLAFAAGRVIEPIDSVVPSGVDVRITVITGDLTQAVGATCAEIIAAPAVGVVTAALPVLPASSFTSGKNLLLVPMGCVGDPTHTDPLEKLACGSTYSVATPNITLAAIGMSHETDAAHLGMQVVHATPATPSQDFRLTPGFDAAVESKLASSVTLGAVGPATPFFGLAELDIGLVTQAKVNTYFPNDSFATSATLLSSIFATSELSESDLVDGETFVLVAVGAYPGIPGGAWWHPLTYALVRANP